jgi:hypothetical protein
MRPSRLMRYPGRRSILASGAGTNQGGMHEVAVRPRGQRLERPAGRQHQLIAISQRIDTRAVETHHRRGIRPIAELPAVAARDIDVVANGDIFQEAKMRSCRSGMLRIRRWGGSHLMTPTMPFIASICAAPSTSRSRFFRRGSAKPGEGTLRALASFESADAPRHSRCCASASFWGRRP